MPELLVLGVHFPENLWSLDLKASPTPRLGWIPNKIGPGIEVAGSAP